MLLFLSLFNIFAVAVFSFVFIKQKRIKGLLLYVGLIASLFFLVVIQTIGVENSISLLIMEYYPIVIWALFALIAIDFNILSKKWKWLLLFLVIGISFATLIIVTFKVDILSDFYRTGHSSPLLAISIIFLLRRVVQFRQKRSFFLLLALVVTYIILNPLTGGSHLSYYVVSMVCFLGISSTFGVLGVMDVKNGRSQTQLFSGKSRPKKQTINRKSFTFMFGSFLTIFILSLLLLTTLVRLLVLRRVELNLSFQGQVIEGSLINFNEKYSSALDLLESLNVSSKEQLQQFLDEEAVARIHYNDIRISNEDLDEKLIKSHSFVYKDNHVNVYNSSNSDDYYFEFTNPQNTISMLVSGKEVFRESEDANQSGQSESIAIINGSNQKIIEPLRASPLLKNNILEKRGVSCQAMLDVCEDGVCPVEYMGFIEQNGVYTDEQVLNSLRPLPEMNACLVTDITESEIFIDPDSRESLYIVVSGVSLIITFLAASILFSKSISQSISKMHEAVQEMQKGDYSKKITIASNDEIDDLATVFNGLIKKLRDSEKNIQKTVDRRTKELKEERNKLQIIIREINDAFVFVNNEGAIELFNNVAEKISGFSAAEAVQSRGTEMISIFEERDPKKPINIFETISSGRKNEMQGIGLLLTREKQLVPTYYSVTRIGSKEKPLGIAMLFKDISKEREIDKMKSNFVSIVSHQFRTPLTAIKWTLEMLLNGDAGEINKEQRHLLDDVIKSNRRLVRLVAELLKVSHLESGKINPELKKVDISPVAKKVIRDHRVAAKNRNIEIIFEYPDDIPEVYTDPVLFENVLENLVSNAIDYTPVSKEEKHIVISAQAMPDEVIIAVRDEGIGISDEEKSRVFSMFYRSDNATKLRADGTGLGLFIAKLMAEMMGGKLWLKSKPGKGTTFFISLSPQKTKSKNP